MLDRRSHSSVWKTYEVARRIDETYSTPFSDALASSGTTPVQAVNKMRMVEELGWPEARRILKDSQGRHLIAKKDDRIWLIKCKPSCWRLYFYVAETGNEKRIVYVHAVCKKADSEDPNDAKRARRIAENIRPGGDRITPFEFPVG